MSQKMFTDLKVLMFKSLTKAVLVMMAFVWCSTITAVTAYAEHSVDEVLGYVQDVTVDDVQYMLERREWIDLDSIEVRFGVVLYGTSSPNYGNVSIPSVLTWKSGGSARDATAIVTNIHDHAFYGLETLTGLKIPDCVKTLETPVCLKCPNLTYFERSGIGVSGIGFYFHTVDGVLFDGDAVKTTEPTILKKYPEGKTGEIYTVPNTVTKLASYSFANTRFLKSILFTGDAPALGKSVFSDSSVGMVYYVKGTKGWEDFAAELPSGVGLRMLDSASDTGFSLVVGAGEISGFHSENGVVVDFKGICPSRLTIPAGVKGISRNVFSGIGALTEVVIGNDVESISYCAFENCVNLASVTIGRNVKTIGGGAFRDCESLDSVSGGENLEWVQDAAFDYTSFADGHWTNEFEVVYLGKCAVTCRGKYSLWDSFLENPASWRFDLKIRAGTTCVANDCFCAMPLTSVELPDSLRYIGENAFSPNDWFFEEDGYRGLTEITIPLSVDFVASCYRAFVGWPNLKKIIFNGWCDGSVERYAFVDGSEKWDEWVANNGVKVESLGTMKLLNIGGIINGWRMITRTSDKSGDLTEDGVLTIPKGAIHVAGVANHNDNSQNSLMLPPVNEWIKSVIVPSSMKSIGSGAFSDCVELTSVKFLGNAPDVGDGIFDETPNELQVKVSSASTGWNGDSSTTLPKTWCGRKISYYDYAVKFNANGGAVTPALVAREYNAALGTLPVPTRTGYRFNGWWTAASGGTQITATTKVTEDITCYAHWIPCFTLVLDKNDGTGTSYTQVVDYGSVTNLPGAASVLKWAPRRGFKFMGWSESQKSKTVYLNDKARLSKNLNAGETKRLYAIWELDTANAYAIQYIRNDGSGSVRTVGFIGGQSTKLNSVSALGFARRGYEFKGWATSTANAREGKVWKGDMGTVSQPVANGKLLQIYAIWSLKSGYYSIKFNKNDGTGKWRELGYEYGKNTTLPTIANGLGWTRAGYTFAGWATSASSTTAWRTDGGVTKTPVAAGKTLNIYAIWKPKSTSSVVVSAAQADNDVQYAVAESSDYDDIQTSDISIIGVTGEGRVFELLLADGGSLGYLSMETADGYVAKMCEVHESDGGLLLVADDDTVYLVTRDGEGAAMLW